MAAATVGHQVDDDVLVEGLTEFEGEVGDSDDSLGIVAIDVEDRRLDHACDIGRVDARAAVSRGRREAHLVVDDHVHGAARAVALQLRQVERLRHHSLAGECRVAVQEQREDVEGLVAWELILLGPDDAFEDGVDCLEVGGISGDVDQGFVTVEAAVGPTGAQVVLHVARALHRLLAVVALELREDLGVGLARDVGKDIEPAAVRHADRNFHDAVARG